MGGLLGWGGGGGGAKGMFPPPLPTPMYHEEARLVSYFN